MIRKAGWADLDGVEQLYNELHDAKEAGLIPVIWKRGVYPSRNTAVAALERDDLFVLEKDGKIIGSGIINQVQNDFYYSIPWKYDVPDDQVCVLHTLGISPAEFKKGYAGTFLNFYEEYAKALGCTELRIDTNTHNEVARGMYRRRGYKEVGTVPTMFNGIPGVDLMLLEKHLEPERDLDP